MKITLLTLSALTLVAGSSQAANIYTMDFSVAGIGSTHDTTGDGFEVSPIVGTNWTMSWPADPSSDTSTNSFITTGGVMKVDDWGGDGSVISNLINIASTTTVDITGTAVTVSSGDAFNASTEGFQWFYSINGGGAVAFGSVGQGFGGSNVGDGVNLSDSVAGLAVTAGDTLEIGFNFNVNGADDGFEVSTMTVNTIPEPSAAILGGLGVLALLRRRR